MRLVFQSLSLSLRDCPLHALHLLSPRRSLFTASHVSTKQEVAIKLEPHNVKDPQLRFEADMYKALQGGVGVPVAHYYGTEGKWNALVLDLLGKSLEDLFQLCGQRLSLKTVLMLTDQLVRLPFLSFFFSPCFFLFCFASVTPHDDHAL